MQSKSANRKPRNSPSAMIGLTKSEVAEFQKLSNCSKLRLDEFEARARDARWIELYLKHEIARLGLAR